MALNSYLDRYRYWRYSFYWGRYRFGVVEKVALALAFAALTGLVAQIRIPLPFTPVPITGQVFGVLLSAVIMGRWYGGLSQAIYVGLGSAGLPWFARWSGGFGVLSGVTGGYIIGFVVTPFVIGWLLERYVGIRRFWPLLGLMMVGVGIIYLLGAIWFSVVMHTGLGATLTGAVLPFIPVDLAKAVAVTLIAHSIVPKTSYNGEVDKARYQQKRI